MRQAGEDGYEDFNVRTVLLSLVVTCFAAPASAADPIHTILGSRVLTGDGVPVTDWAISYTLYTDIGPDRVVNHSKTVSVQKLKLNGVKYDPDNAVSAFGPHNEVLQWCSLHWPVAIEIDDGVANLTPLKGDEARKVHKMAGNEDWKSPYDGTAWRHCGLTKMRELNREFDKKHPPQPDNSHLLGPTEAPRPMPPDAEKRLRNAPMLPSPHGRIPVPMSGRRLRQID